MTLPMELAAKQAAFEEQNRIKNQFRPLDDDEVDFLDDVRRAERDKEEALRMETEQGLDRFREARTKRDPEAAEEPDEESRGGSGAGALEQQQEEGGVVEEWTTTGGRKRKREKEGKGLVIKGLKRRTSEAVQDDDKDEGAANDGVKDARDTGVAPRSSSSAGSQAKETQKKPDPPPAPPSKPKLGLVDYGSDEDDSDE